MKCITYLILLSLALFLACQGANRAEEKVVNTRPEKYVGANQKTETTPPDLRSIYLANKVFETGGNEHFTDSCTFYFECDCCSGELLFNRDSSFYSLDYCLADRVFTYGKYSIRKNALILNFSGRCVREIYNWEHDTDSTLVDYFQSDTLVTPYSIAFSGVICNQRLVLKENKGEESEMAIESAVNYKARVEDLTKNGFLGRLNKLAR